MSQRRKESSTTPTGTSAEAAAAFPKSIQPMLATLVNEPFDGAGWLYEVKWDGYRALAFMQSGEVELKSRNNKSFNEKFYPIYEAVKAWGIDAVVDGEIVVVNEKGAADFGALQNWRSEADGQLLYYVFDILWLNGRDLMQLPLYQRKEILSKVMPAEGPVKTGFSVEGSGTSFFEAAERLGLEGIIAKRSDSEYRPGDRSRDWLKIKVHKRQEVIVLGYTNNEGSSKPFSALLLGVYDKGELKYVGKVGTGFSNKLQKELLKQFEPFITEKSPLKVVPDYNKPSRFRPNPPRATAVWLKPELVCEVSFAEVTSDGVFRHPSFEGMRTDKNARDVEREYAATDEALNLSPDELQEQVIQAPEKSERKSLLNPRDETQVRSLEGKEVKFTNLSKIFWPEEKVSKRDMLNYYYQVAPYILPYLKDRPQSLNRFPNGIYGKSFYQKDVTGKAPSWADTFPYRSNNENQDRNYLVACDEASLLYMANLGAIEMNPWNSTIQRPDCPDWCVLDLDPDTGNTFEQVIETALVVKEVLDSIEVPGYCKTSGSTGIHIYIPLDGQYDYDQCQLFGKWVATQVHKALPGFTSIERLTRNRKGKLYVDYLQNRPKATLAAPYSLRPKPGATVSMPLHWHEVKPGLKLRDFTIFNAVDRIRSEGDIFKPVLGPGIDLMAALKKAK